MNKRDREAKHIIGHKKGKEAPVKASSPLSLYVDSPLPQFRSFSPWPLGPLSFILAFQELLP